MNLNHTSIILLGIGGVILTAGDIVFKKWVITNKLSLFVVGLFVYMFGEIFLALSFKHKTIVEASLILIFVNIIILSFVSRFYFKEPWTIYELIGVIAGLGLIVFLELTPP